MKALVVLSGGQDSTTCLADAIATHGVENVHAITFDYGQRHRVEISSALLIAKLAKISARHEVVTVSRILKGTSPLVDQAATVDLYSSTSTLPGGLEKTFVPMRNTLFLTIAANRAVDIAMHSGDSVFVITGVSQEDYGGYPDCRADFLHAYREMLRASLDDPDIPEVLIDAPLLFLNKAATVLWSEGIEGARQLLAFSHTCYNGQVPPCGHCHACLLRAKGYQEACVIDPLIERLATMP